MTSDSDIVGALFTHSVIFLCPPVGVLGPLGSVGEARTPPLPSGTLPSLLHLHMMAEDENRQVYSTAWRQIEGHLRERLTQLMIAVTSLVRRRLKAMLMKKNAQHPLPPPPLETCSTKQRALCATAPSVMVDPGPSHFLFSPTHSLTHRRLKNTDSELISNNTTVTTSH